MSKKKILIVDDDRTYAASLNTILSKAGYETFVAYEGKTIFETVKKFMPDLILLDIVMPEINGFQIKAKLNKNASTAAIPVIFVTVKDEIPGKIEGFHLGADDYIIKPFNQEELLARIDAILNKKSFYEKISMTDGLTGLYNVRFFKRQFALFFNTAKRYKKVFSLAIIDINKFKHINDKHGHAAGDFVLKKFSSIAKKVLRESDIIARYGGDEFVIIMPETSARYATDAIKRLRDKIEGKTFRFHDAKLELRFSFSAGIATYSNDLKSKSKMFKLADERLYKNKRKRK